MQNRALFIQIHYCQFKKACYNKFNPKKRKELFGKDGHENEEGYESAVPAGGGRSGARVLCWLCNAAFPPFEYVENDEVVGVDVDIANEIAKELGVKLTVQDMEFDLIIDYIKAGKGDIGAAGITADDERRKQVDFSVEYITSTQYVIVPAGTDTKTFKLDGKVIGVQEGTTGDVYYASDAEVIKAKEVKKYKSAIDAAADMLLGRVDCVIIDELPAKKITEKNAGKMICYDAGYEPESYAIAVKKDNEELLDAINTVLKRLMDEGKIQEYVVKHS